MEVKNNIILAMDVTTIKEAADICSPESARHAVYSLTDKGMTRRANQAGKDAIYELEKCEDV